MQQNTAHNALEAQLEQLALWSNLTTTSPVMEAMRTQMLEWEGAAPSAPDVRRGVIHSLERANPYFVSQEICELLADSVTTFPNNPLETYQPIDGVGFVLFEQSFLFYQNAERPDEFLNLKAALWTLCHRGRRQATDRRPYVPPVAISDDVPPNLIELVLFTELPDGRMRTFSVSNWSFLQGWNGSPGEDNSIVELLQRLMGVFFAFIRQRISITVTAQAPRATKRRLARQGFDGPMTVEIVQLRALSREKQEAGESFPGNWSHRWITRTHWRNQYYPSTDSHKPKLIPAYVKGPPDKPLRVKGSKLFQVDR